MAKTPKQQVLELQRKKPIEEVLRGALARFQGRHNCVPLAALSLEVSGGTIYSWCAQLGIDVREYRTDENQSEEEIEALKQEVMA